METIVKLFSETWKPIPEYPDYLVSDTGLVRSLKFNGDRLLKPQMRGGYLVIHLQREGKQISKKIHQLVLLAFVGTPPNGTQIRRLDGAPLNNHLENLAYGTPKENMADKALHGRNWQANKTECPKGHLYDEKNTYIVKSNSKRTGRLCRTCAREWQTLHRAKASNALD